jgi:hypothetical protein
VHTPSSEYHHGDASPAISLTDSSILLLQLGTALAAARGSCAAAREVLGEALLDLHEQCATSAVFTGVPVFSSRQAALVLTALLQRAVRSLSAPTPAAVATSSADGMMLPSSARADMTTLPAVDTICTAPSLIPTVNGNTVRSFSTHGHQSAAKGSSTTVSRSDIRLILTF